MLAKVYTCALLGLEGILVEVEVDTANGNPFFAMVGLPDTAVQEARERVRAAIKNSGGYFPGNKRVVVNLAPADVRKEGPAYDLPIAVGILVSASDGAYGDLSDAIFLGELSLDGSLRHSDGVLPMVSVAKGHGIRRIFVPAMDAKEAALVEGVSVYPVATLRELEAHLAGRHPIAPIKRDLTLLQKNHEEDSRYDFSLIKGQEHAKRALEIAAAGGHNVFMSGPPGSGKTLLARTMVTLLPPMTIDEALEVTKIYSVSGLLPSDTPLVIQRPFRSPHHSISSAGLVGGGRFPRPGEISLAHRGVLFLDELPEFGQQMLDQLRQPLEDDRTLVLSRASGSVKYPANFILVGAMNPCPCGYLGDSQKACVCPPARIQNYQKRLSGPLLDRIDIHIEVPRVEYEKLADTRLGEPSARMRERVARAREIQLKRFDSYRPSANEESKTPRRLFTNSEMGAGEVRVFCKTDTAAESLLKAATRQMALSARAYHRILKLARTIADLSGSEAIQAAHIAEAIQYRRKEQV
ncbi:MAG: YifB family Mg chelatase-like AAA ATPase [Chloroflexota bacterium]